MTSYPSRYASARDAPYRIAPRITHIDRAIIRAYFHQLEGSLTKVRTSARLASCSKWSLGSELPQVHETLLPRELEQKLSTLGVEHQRVRARNDVLLVNAKTRIVMDVLRDIHVTV